MIWNHPSAFLALIILPAIFYLVARANRLRNKEIELVFSEDMRARLFISGSRSLLVIKHAFLFVALVAFVALERPKRSRRWAVISSFSLTFPIPCLPKTSRLIV